MSILKMIIDIANRLKPFLVKIVPVSLLQSMKRRYLAWCTGRLKKENIKPFDRTYYVDGVNLIGNIRGDFGLGQSCRLVAGELQDSGTAFGV